MLDWDDLRFFLAVRRIGTLAGTARILKVNQTTVGRRLAALEAALGVLLFDRTPEGLRLTSAGQDIVDATEKMEEAAMAVERRIAGTDARLEGTVRIACSETLAIGFLVERCAALRVAHPGISLVFLTGNPPLNLARREADLAIRVARPTQMDLVVRKLAEIDWGLYGAANQRHSSRRGEPLPYASFVGFEEELAGTPAARWLAEHVPAERIRARSNSILTAAAAILAGLGVGPLPAFVANGDRRLRLVPPGFIARAELHLVVHPDLAGQSRVRAVMEFLIGLFRCSEPLFRAVAPRRR